MTAGTAGTTATPLAWRGLRSLLGLAGTLHRAAVPTAPSVGTAPTAPAVAVDHPEVLELRAEVERLTALVREKERLHRSMAPVAVRGTGRPSWQASVRQWQRQYAEVGRLPQEHRVPHRRLSRKLDGYRLAASHGVRVPRVHAVWSRVDHIEVSGLPEEFVLKSDRGSTSEGVLPLRRTAEGYAVVAGDRALGPDGPRETMRQLRERRRVSGPYFAEELLRDGTGSALPHDVKVFAFYGEVGQVMVRAVPRHGDLDGLRKRFLWPDGTDVGEAIPGQDPRVPLPPHFEEVVQTARRLSLAVPFPFVRVDLYDGTDGVTMGELTLVPGGIQCWSLEHDTHLGRLAEQAQARLWRDLARGRPFDFVPGDHPADGVVPAPSGG